MLEQNRVPAVHSVLKVDILRARNLIKADQVPLTTLLTFTFYLLLLKLSPPLPSPPPSPSIRSFIHLSCSLLLNLCRQTIFGGKSDPYVVLSVGESQISFVEEYIENSVNPE